MYVVYDIISNDNGVGQHEKVMFMYQDGVDLVDVLHNLALEYIMSPEGLKKYGQTGLPFDKFFEYLSPEKLEPYNVEILWLDREAKELNGTMIINRCELKSYLTLIERTEERTKERLREMRILSEQYVRRMERLKADGHPLISTWESAQVTDRALSWAWQFARARITDPIKFFEKKLAECVYKAGLPPQNVAWSGESDPQTA